jgi:ubiquitin conjugation factor E4 B
MASDSLSLELMLIEKVLKISLSRDTKTAIVKYDTQSFPHINKQLANYKQAYLMDDPTFIDTILIERFSVPQTTILSYASESYLLARTESQKNINLSNPRAQKFLKYLQEIIINYSALSMYQPDMFPSQFPYSEASGVELSSFRIVDFLEHGGSKDFLVLLTEYWNREDYSFCEELFTLILVLLNKRIKSMTLLDDPALVAGVFKDILEIRGLPTKIKEIGLYNDKWTGQEIELESLFGSYLSPSLFPKPGYFNKIPGLPGQPDAIRERIGSEIKQIKYKLDFVRALEKYSSMSKSYTAILTNIFKFLLKEERKKTIDWLCGSVTNSVSKSKLGNRLGSGNANTSPSDGFCMSLLDILLQICNPFLNPRDERVSKISELYMGCNSRMVKVQDTPLCNTISKLQVPESEVGTVTEFYYCCSLMFHYSWHTAKGFYTDVNRVLQRLHNKNSPGEKSDFEYYLQIKSCFDVILMDPYRNSLLLKLSSLTLHLILQWSGFAGTLPLPEPRPVLSIIPEYFIEDISEFYVTMLELQTDVLNTMSNEQLIDLLTSITVILNSPGHFTNPYIRAKFVKSFSLMLSGKSVGEITSVMNFHSLFQQFFMQGLVKFFVDIEFGGGHSQFYDKFEYRHYTSKIFEYLWRYPHYQHNTIILQDQDYFKKFINYILNDMNYCLNDGIENLIKIKKFQDKKSKQPATPEEEEEFSKVQGTCKYMMQQSNEYISMIKQLSDWNSAMFISEEFGERTAAMLNNYLKLLCGPKCLELKVENPREYNFMPEELLGNLIIIYLHISRHQQFFECLIKDERSFSIDVFNKALNVCQKKPIIQYDERENFRNFIVQLKEFDGNKWEPNEGEIPEEFLCPISFDLMKNPVKLPSGTTVDRVSIVRHLLSDEHDPFNRQPLKPADLIEDLELKAKIDLWVAVQKNKKVLDSSIN